MVIGVRHLAAASELICQYRFIDISELIIRCWFSGVTENVRTKMWVLSQKRWGRSALGCSDSFFVAETSSWSPVSHRMTSLLLMLQGGDLTAISATTTEAMTNAVLIIVRPQKSFYARPMPVLSAEIFHGQQQRAVTGSEQLPGANT